MRNYKSLLLVLIILSACNSGNNNSFIKEFEDVSLSLNDTTTLVEGNVRKSGVYSGTWEYKDLSERTLVVKQYMDSLNRYAVTKHYDSENKLIHYEATLDGNIQISQSFKYSDSEGSKAFPGKLLFNEYCSGCHTTRNYYVGPSFEGESYDFVFKSSRSKSHLTSDSRIEKLDSAHIQSIIEYVNERVIIN